MKRHHLTSIIACVALIAACSQPTRSRNLGDPGVSAITLAQQVCSNCHGVEGRSTSPNFPNLAGQTEAYTAAQLKSFRSHGRRDPAGFEYMWGLSRGLTDEQISGLAAYYSGRQPARQSPAANAAQLAAGKALFETGVPAKNVPACSTCHGANGEGNATFPRIAGQHADYLVKQLIVFQRTDERPEGAIMKTVAHELARDDIESVAAYVQSF